MCENCTCGKNEGKNVDWLEIFNAEMDLFGMIRNYVEQNFSEPETQKENTIKKPETITEVEKLFLEFVPLSNRWLAKILFDHIALLCVGADLSFEVLLSKIPDELENVMYFGKTTNTNGGEMPF